MSDQYIRMRYSDNGQPQWTNWQTAEIGEVGEYGKIIAFTRLGQFRTRVINIRISSPRRRDVLGAVAVLQPTIG